MGEATPTDGRFRRGLYVMLVVVGLLAAGGLIYAKQSAQDVRSANSRATRAEAAASDARAQVATLIEMQRASTERDRLATRERAALLRRSAAQERLLVRLLAESDDPTIRDAFRDYTRAQTRAPSPPAQSQPSPRPSPSASPTPRPSPSPSPRPCRIRNPIDRRCLVV